MIKITQAGRADYVAKISFSIFTCMVIVLSGCQMAPVASDENTVSKKELLLPALNSSRTIKPSQTLFMQMEYVGSVIYKATEHHSLIAPRALGVGNYEVEINPSNVFIKGKTDKNEAIICSVEKLAKNYFSQLSICLTETSPASGFNKLIVNQADWTKSPILDKPIKFSENEIVFNPSGPTKRELIFNGYDNGKLSLSYKEYRDAQILLNQPLFISVASLPATIGIKQATFALTEYIDGSLTYTVLNAMPNYITGKEQTQCVTPGFNFITAGTIENCARRKMTVFPLGYYPSN